MRELVLVLPDLFLSAAGSDGAATARLSAASLIALRFAAPRQLRGDWRGMLARGVGRADLALVDVASVVDAALPRTDRAAEGAAEVWLAAPLHLMAGLKTLHFPANGLLRLPADEARELAAGFADVFGGDGLALEPAGSAGFVLRGFSASEVATVDPSRLIGGQLEASLPEGAGSAALRALGSEIEMWLHELPLNRRREQRGEPRVSTLWLWGGGQPPRDPLTIDRTTESRWSQLVGDDAWLQALARLAGVESAALGATLEPVLAVSGEAVCVVAPLAGGDPAEYEQRYLAPALAAMAEGRLGTCVLVANDRWLTITRNDRWRLWRPRRSWLAALADGGA